MTYNRLWLKELEKQKIQTVKCFYPKQPHWVTNYSTFFLHRAHNVVGASPRQEHLLRDPPCLAEGLSPHSAWRRVVKFPSNTHFWGEMWLDQFCYYFIHFYTLNTHQKIGLKHMSVKECCLTLSIRGQLCFSVIEFAQKLFQLFHMWFYTTKCNKPPIYFQFFYF